MHLYATRKLDMDEISGSFSGKIYFCCSLKKFVLEDGVRGKYYSDYHLQSVLSCLLTVIHPTLHCWRTSTLRSGNRCYMFLSRSLSLSLHVPAGVCFVLSVLYPVSSLLFLQVCYSQEFRPLAMRWYTSAVPSPTWTSPSQSRSGGGQSTTSLTW